MLRLKKLLFFQLFSLSIFVAKSQQIEVGMLLGASNYMGDLSNETFLLKETHFAAALFGRYNFTPRFALNGFIGYGRVSGDDKNFITAKRNYNDMPDYEFNKYRNLNFYSDIYEFSVHAEYNLLPNNLKYYTTRPFLPYVFIGLGMFNFNPKTKFLGKTVELQPLGTEGQGSTTYNDIKKYPLTTICLPLGLGFRQKIGDDFFIGIEAGIRFTNTNYLDDVGGKYADRSVIGGATGRAGLLLSDRTWELTPGADPYTEFPLKDLNWAPYIDKDGVAHGFTEGDKRSDRHFNKNDMYFMAGITISYVLRFRGQGCPSIN